MVVKRWLYFVLLFFIVVIAAITIANIVGNDTTSDYKGTLVDRVCQEASV